MPVGGITHGFQGYTKVGSVYVLSNPGGRFAMPRALNVPYPLSYSLHGYVNFADGLRFPVVTAPAIPMDSTTPWFTGTLLSSWFFTRSAVPAFDLTAISGGIIFSDNGIASGTGLGTFRCLSPKGAGFTVFVEKGQPVGMLLRFAGTDRDTTVGALPTGPLDGTPLMFDSVTLGGDLASAAITGVTLNYDTGLTPNMELDGTLRPVEMNAGMPTASLQIRMNSTNSANAPGWNSDPAAYTSISGTITLRRATGVGNSVRFTFVKGILLDPDERNQVAGRVARVHNYNLIGTTSADPLAVADV